MANQVTHSSEKPETILTHGGRNPADHFGFVNTPVYRGSTVLFPTLDAIEGRTQPYGYGRTGNPSTTDVEAVVTALEGAAGTRLAPSGLSAITTALMSVVGSGDDILVTDSAYEPTRNVCNTVLGRMGVSTRYYDPRIGAGIADLIGPDTKAVFVESPGSLTFEIQDLPAIADAAHKVGAKVLIDNSWATPLYFKPLELGADMVIHAGTKMFVGHSDAMSGTISANAATFEQLAATHRAMGICAAPDEAYLIARGLRTLSIRMQEHRRRALDIASWLEGQDGVAAVLHPALESHPDNALFRRDFSGSGSLFSVLLEPAPREAVAALVDNMRVFGMGYSWGGYESLILPTKPGRVRTAVPWVAEGNLLRLHIGFEDVDDLKADLSDGLERYRAARAG
ncbi:MAG: cystathionine beta-lyase [Alphaproteobacteria bacterium]|nr:cystathionine beta-lyase [Alphaproteobacteria bacterium]